MRPKRILITRTDRLGDVVLSTPVIRHLRKLFPDAYLAFMVRPENRDVAANNPHLDEVIIYDKYVAQKSFPATVKFALELKKRRFDTAIALHPTNRVHVMLFLAGIAARIGYGRKMGFLLTRSLPHGKQEGVKHEADYNFDLLGKAGFDVEGADITPYIVTSDEEKRTVDSMQKSEEMEEGFIAIHAGASCPSKRWPAERFARVGDILSEKHNLKIALVGGNETEKYSSLVTSKMRRKPVDLTGGLLLGELAEFLSRCRVFISNDSGPVHVATAVKAPVLAIFGRKDPGLSPKRWGPLGEKCVVLHKDVGCKKCRAHNCDKDFECLKAISIEEVVEAAEKLI
ncbi:MAG: lipopolysaccharide heptosyltransferase II [Candidatus Omnitrophota bacterium]